MELWQELLRDETIRSYFQSMRLGIEKESHRVTLTGELTENEHPKNLGKRAFHPYIQTDFSESQIEIITPIGESPEEILNYLAAFHDVTLRSMESNEMLWPLSMPTALPIDEKMIQIAKLENQEEVLYRRHLAKEYGKRKQMVSGIHYNFEFTPEFIERLFAMQSQFESLEELRTFIYLKVSNHYLRYRWFVTYLFGGSPYAEKGYFVEKVQPMLGPVRSIRNSLFGYTNREEVKVSFHSIEKYTQDIEDLVEKGILSEEKEFYAPVRLRGGKKVRDLKAYGVNYIEVRNIDLNPFASYGISKDEIRFLQLFLMYMLWQENTGNFSDEEIELGNKMNNAVALENPLEMTQYLAEGMALIAGMKEMIEACGFSQTDVQIIEEAEEKLNHPENTLAGKIVEFVENGHSNHELGVLEGLRLHQKAHERPYQLAGFQTMELSTQIFLFDTIQRGIEFKILDKSDQILELKHKKHIEYVKNANMTGKDTYIVPLMMENKTVTKKLLKKSGFQVPGGHEFYTLESALEAYDFFFEQAIVVKPKSTNYGIGISIFKEGASREAYQEALEIAFAADQAVLVEEFVSGTEYRFFVIDGKATAILLRVPANVSGDGIHTVKELVEKKNDNPLRGTHHLAPLEKIQLGNVELLNLRQQGLTPNSIPDKNQVIYLRENSNISSGGDSIDVTDEFDASYFTIAEEAVEAIGAKICGIDLIIPDKDQIGEKNSKNYSIIEANFNPAMHMHIYPYAGRGRRLTMEVLDFLFPEIKNKR